MSRPRRLDAYPAWLVSLLAGFEADRCERTLYFDTAREARAFQLDLSGFRGAVRAEGAEAEWPNVLAMRSRRLAADDGGTRVRLYHADDTPQPKIV